MAEDGDYDGINGDAWEVLARVEHGGACTSEKALNMEMLLIKVEDVASDYAALFMQSEDHSSEDVAKAFEFDILSGILKSEVKDLDDIMVSLQASFVDAGRKLLGAVQSEDLSTEIEKKLLDADKSLKRTQDVVADVRKRSAKFESDLAFAGLGTRSGADVEMEISPYSPTKAREKEQAEQPRHFLQMLEKSLARELDLEEKLTESRHNEDELKLKLHYAEQVTYSLEESMGMILQRAFEAENAAETLLGISKEFTGKLQVVQFNLKGSVLREGEARSMLEESTKILSVEGSAVQKLKTNYAEGGDLKANLQEAEGEGNPAISEVLSLRDKVRALEEQLRESDSQLQIAKASAEANQEQQNRLLIELREMENVARGLREDVLRLENRAESAEEECAQLTKTNVELNEQLGFLSTNGTEKENILERKLEESDLQLEHAKALVEANEENMNMLYSALSDMENLIEDLKGKVSKAESRAESAESKCTLLTDTNLELNEELGFLRSKLESMQLSLNRAEDAKIATAKDIGVRTKFITDLVIKLAMEREHLQLQISSLTKRNKFLAKKNLKTKDSSPDNAGQKETDKENNFSILEPSEEALTESATSNIQAEDKSAAAMPSSITSIGTTTTSTTLEGPLAAESKLETVRTIEATQLNFKYLVLAVLILLVSIFAIYLFQLES